MSKNKNKNHYGTFLMPKTPFAAIKKKTAVIILGVVFIGGLSGVAYEKFFKSKSAKVAETKQVDNGIPGWWYQQYFKSSVCDKDACQPDADPDLDKLTNAQEFYYHSDPLNPHTVKDVMDDGELVAAGFDPSRPGHMTFDQVASDDNIVLESLVYEDDIKQLVAKTQDISQVNLPLVQDSELNIDMSGSTQSYNNYLGELNSKVERYFPQNNLDNITATIKSDTGPGLDDINTKSQMLATDLKSMTVPAKLVSFHKYMIAFYQLLPQVLPGTNIDTSSDAWYDKAQAFLALQQKLDFEKELLSKQFNP